MSDVYLSSGLRTPFVKAGGSFAKYTALDLSRPVAAAMAAKARPAGGRRGDDEPCAPRAEILRRRYDLRAIPERPGSRAENALKRFGITREEQDRIALWSHQRAVAGQDEGFFSDLVLPFGDVDRDTFPRRDTSAERLAALKPAFDPVNGSLTAGNSSPLTDGASSLWVADKEGLARLGGAYAAKLVDWEIAAMDFRLDEGILMAPARAIPRLLARHRLGLRRWRAGHGRPSRKRLERFQVKCLL